MGYITKGKIMKNFLKLLTLSFFGMFAASDIEASTSGYLNTYNYGGVSTTIGSIGSSNVYLNTYDYTQPIFNVAINQKSNIGTPLTLFEESNELIKKYYK